MRKYVIKEHPGLKVSICNHVMPCPFTAPKIFCAGRNFLSQPKNLTAFSATSKTSVPE